ncbi:MAG: T9SS type A sorting domain-containing protein [Bacteroidota bacterium]
MTYQSIVGSPASETSYYTTNQFQVVVVVDELTGRPAQCYPSVTPANGTVYLTIPNPSAVQTLEIRTSSGTTVYTHSGALSGGQTLQVSSLSPGQYVFVITSPSGDAYVGFTIIE